MVLRNLRFESETRELARVRAFVEAAAEEGGVGPGERRRLALAVDEAVSNVIEHGYLGRPDGPIEVEVRIEGRQRVEIRIRDEGRRFDASAARPEAPRPGADGELRTRGYGLLLIHRLMDEVRYCLQRERVNELTLVRLLEGGKTIPGAAL